MSSIPCFEIGAQGGVGAEDAARLGAAFKETGFCSIVGHGLDQSLVDQCRDEIKRFFELPLKTKLAYQHPAGPGIRGYTGFGVEVAKGADVPDLKEFWHTGRELEGSSTSQADYAENLWPEELPDFKLTVLSLFKALDRVAAHILSLLAVDIGLEPDFFDGEATLGNSVLRAIHYPPLTEAQPDAVRAAAHEDINFITLLVASDMPGLQIRTREGRWIDVEQEPGTIVCNIGDMFQRLTNGVYRSTTHRVINPAQGLEGTSRYSMPFFVHPRSDFLIKTLDGCVSKERPNQFPDAIRAGDYLKERLAENRLTKTEKVS